MSKIALFDMDDTLVDFQGVIRERFKRMLGPNEQMPSDFWQMEDHLWERVQSIKAQSGFWRDLPPLQWGWDIMEVCKNIGYEIHIVTKMPNISAYASSEKVEWARKNLPGVPLHIVNDKSIVYGRVLVDDHMPFIDAWLDTRPRGLVITTAQGHFRNNVVRYHQGMDVIRRRLEKAFKE